MCLASGHYGGIGSRMPYLSAPQALTKVSKYWGNSGGKSTCARIRHNTFGKTAGCRCSRCAPEGGLWEVLAARPPVRADYLGMPDPASDRIGDPPIAYAAATAQNITDVIDEALREFACILAAADFLQHALHQFGGLALAQARIDGGRDHF